jgi:hypothetical protein
MGNNISIGDVRVEKLVITSPRGSLTLTTSFVSASIYESIFTPGIVCDITVLDSQDIVGNLRILGDELVEFNMLSPSDVRANYKFALYERGEGQQLANQRAKTYVLKCVSIEAMYAQNEYVQKGYENVLNSEIVEDIAKTYLRTDKQIITEQTRSPQILNISNLSPYKAINLVKSRSISAENQSSSYVFFETRNGDDQIFKFVTIENLFTTNVVKSFMQSSAININVLSPDQDRNILSYQVPTALSSLDRISLGGPTRVTTFNFTTWQYEIQDIHASDTVFKDGSTSTSGTDISGTFRNRYLNPKIPPQSFIPVDNSQRPVTYIAEGTPNLQAYIALLLQNSLKIRVPGDFILAPGVTINCTFPNNSATTGNVTEDPLLSGKFLISRIHHKIGLVQEKPRYTCIVECLKGRYREG